MNRLPAPREHFPRAPGIPASEDATLNRLRLSALSLVLCLATAAVAQAPLPAPGFHHIHLNSIDPEAAADFYAAQFPSSTRTTFAGLPALKTGSVYLLFNKVKLPPATAPQTALWHFGWQVADIHEKLALLKQHPGVRLVPLYIANEAGAVVPAEIAEATDRMRPYWDEWAAKHSAEAVSILKEIRAAVGR